MNDDKGDFSWFVIFLIFAHILMLISILNGC